MTPTTLSPEIDVLRNDLPCGIQTTSVCVPRVSASPEVSSPPAFSSTGVRSTRACLTRHLPPSNFLVPRWLAPPWTRPPRREVPAPGVQDRWLKLAAPVCSRESMPRRARPGRTGVSAFRWQKPPSRRPFPGITRAAILSCVRATRASDAPSTSLTATSAWSRDGRRAHSRTDQPGLLVRRRTMTTH
jgi:hypothetical protein